MGRQYAVNNDQTEPAELATEPPIGPAGEDVDRRRGPGALVGLPLYCGLAAVVAVLLVAAWQPWQANLSGWALLSASGGLASVSGYEWWAVVLIPVTAVVCVLAMVRSTRAVRLPLLVVAAAGAACVLADAVGSADRLVWLGWGMGAAVAGYPVVFVLGVVLVLLPAPERRVMRRPGTAAVAAAVATVVVLSGAVWLGGSWYAARPVTATTADSAPPPPITGPAGRTLWQVGSTRSDDAGSTMGTGTFGANFLTGPDGMAPVVLADGLVAVVDGPGATIVVRDVATGTQRWQYTRRDAALMSATASRDGQTLVATYDAGVGAVHAVSVGFDASTGVVRWQSWSPYDSVHVFSRVVTLPDAIVTVLPGDRGSASAIDPMTGRTLWSVHGLWSETSDQGCASIDAGVAADADLTVLMVHCGTEARDGSPRLEMRAVDRSGRTRWAVTDPISTPADGAAMFEFDSLLAVDANAVVVYHGDTRRVLVLDPTTGRTRWTMDDGTEQWVGIAGNAMLTATERFDNTGRIVGSAQLRLRALATGTPLAAQPPSDLGLARPRTDAESALEYATTVRDDATVRDGRAYVLVNGRGGHAALAVLDVATARVTASYPLPLAPVAHAVPNTPGPATVAPGDGYVIVTGTPTGGTKLTSIVLRLPAN